MVLLPRVGQWRTMGCHWVYIHTPLTEIWWDDGPPPRQMIPGPNIGYTEAWTLLQSILTGPSSRDSEWEPTVSPIPSPTPLASLSAIEDFSEEPLELLNLLWWDLVVGPPWLPRWSLSDPHQDLSPLSRSADDRLKLLISFPLRKREETLPRNCLMKSPSTLHEICCTLSITRVPRCSNIDLQKHKWPSKYSVIV